MLLEQPSKVPRRDTDTLRERLDAGGVECTVANQPHRTRHNRRRPKPGRRAGRRLGSAAETRAESGRFRGGRGPKIAHVLVVRCACRTDRPAVNLRRRHGDEETSVEARVARAARAVADAAIQLHASELSASRRVRLVRNGREQASGIRTQASGLVTDD